MLFGKEISSIFLALSTQFSIIAMLCCHYSFGFYQLENDFILSASKLFFFLHFYLRLCKWGAQVQRGTRILFSLSFIIFHVCFELISFDSNKKSYHFKRSGVSVFCFVHSPLVSFDTEVFSGTKQIGYCSSTLLP